MSTGKKPPLPSPFSPKPPEQRTGADAIADTVGPPAEKPQRDEVTPGPSDTEGQRDKAGDLRTTTVRLEWRQIRALKAAAERAVEDRVARGKAPGKADASEVLRKIIDEWIARGGK